jgi:hypothetical protein
VSGKSCRPRGDVRLERLVWVTVVAILLAATASPAARYSGGAGTPADPYLISTSRDLLTLAADVNDWASHFRLTADIDMADVPRSVACVIGDEGIPFRGIFDGAGRTIYHYTCITTGRNRVGLFGHIRGLEAEIRDLRLVEPYVDASSGVSAGPLIGHLGTGTAINCHVEGGYVHGSMGVGGLIGWTYATVLQCTAQAEVHGDYSAGGLIGICSPAAEVRDCWANATVTGINRVGGLVGGNTLATIHWCSADSFVTGTSNAGGLLGVSEGGTISDCYSTASVNASSTAGGLVALSDMSCHCSGGSLPSLIRHCYSTGAVRSDTDAGGLIGWRDPNCTVEESFWDTQTSGMTTSADGTGLTTAQLQVQSTFKSALWSFTAGPGSDDYWVIRREPQYPRFAWQIIDGDFDGDLNVDLRDFSSLAQSWSKQSTAFRTGGANIAGSNWVDALDLQVLCQNWLVGAKQGR